MRILVLSSRFPFPSHTGDRLRLTIWLDALRDHDVTLVSPPGIIPEAFKHVSLVPARRSGTALLRNLIVLLRSRAPFHSMIAGGWGWPEAIGAAQSRGEYDVTIVFLSRFHPFVSGELGKQRKILEAIDSLAMSMGERAREARVPARWFWRIEQKRTERLERKVARHYERVLVVNEEEKELFGERTVAIPNGVILHPLDAKALRPYSFAFWGRLAYFANEDAVRLLLTRLWPAIHSALPDARLLIAGADASLSLRALSRRPGVEMISPIVDRAEMLRKVSVALFPLRFGTGQSNKVLEAAEAGCAIVSTSAGVRGLADLAPLCMIEDDLDRLTERAIELGKDDSISRAMGRRLRVVVEQHYDRRTTEARLREIVSPGGSSL